METKNYKQLALAAGIVAALLLAGFFFTGNRSLKQLLVKEKLTSESLLSEKLALDKSVEKLNGELTDVKSKNDQFGNKIMELGKSLDESAAELRKAQSENSTLRRFRTRARELETINGKLNEEISSVKREMETEKQRFSSEKQRLSDQVSNLAQENNRLATANSILSAMAGNNHRVETVRGKNDKQTVKARRTQKLVLSFELPANVAENITFAVSCPDGQVYESKDNKSASVKIAKNSRNFFANNSELLAAETKTIEMTFVPEEKLKKGSYEFRVYNNGMYIGTNRFSLR
jgi:DNA repair exonuclease SbcCD ATPase subunit